VLGRYLLLVLLCLGCLHADVEKVKAEPNLTRRSTLALDEAESALTAARKSYDGGQMPEFQKDLKEAGDLVELSYEALQDTGKRARHDPKWFKKAEQRLLVMLRRVDALAKDVSTDDRAVVEAVQKRFRDVHDQLVQDIMSKK